MPMEQLSAFCSKYLAAIAKGSALVATCIKEGIDALASEFQRSVKIPVVLKPLCCPIAHRVAQTRVFCYPQIPPKHREILNNALDAYEKGKHCSGLADSNEAIVSFVEDVSTDELVNVLRGPHTSQQGNAQPENLAAQLLCNGLWGVLGFYDRATLRDVAGRIGLPYSPLQIATRDELRNFIVVYALPSPAMLCYFSGDGSMDLCIPPSRSMILPILEREAKALSDPQCAGYMLCSKKDVIEDNTRPKDISALCREDLVATLQKKCAAPWQTQEDLRHFMLSLEKTPTTALGVLAYTGCMHDAKSMELLKKYRLPITARSSEFELNNWYWAVELRHFLQSFQLHTDVSAARAKKVPKGLMHKRDAMRKILSILKQNRKEEHMQSNDMLFDSQSQQASAVSVTIA